MFHQYSVSADGTYRHIDFSLIGLASASGIWREARLKLFDRRGITGIEIRKLRGWPQVFDNWPGDDSDRFGPFWRLEKQNLSAAVVALGSPCNRAVVAALIEVMPIASRRAAVLAGLSEQDQEDWSARGSSLVAAVAEAHEPAAALAGVTLTGQPPATEGAES